MEWSAILACRDFGVCLPSLSKRVFPRQRNDTTKLSVVAFQSLQIDFCQPR